jgi:hypothetical protein
MFSHQQKLSSSLSLSPLLALWRNCSLGKMPVIGAVARLVTRQAPATARYDWILAITFIAYIFSAASNGANDVANAYATSVYVLLQQKYADPTNKAIAPRVLSPWPKSVHWHS